MSKRLEVEHLREPHPINLKRKYFIFPCMTIFANVSLTYILRKGGRRVLLVYGITACLLKKMRIAYLTCLGYLDKCQTHCDYNQHGTPCVINMCTKYAMARFFPCLGVHNGCSISFTYQESAFFHYVQKYFYNGAKICHLICYNQPFAIFPSPKQESYF